ncbi:MAG TPA: sulfite exporter TauE/SafE family protein [Lysobacter sp.]|nr:sulfite exporter TauE/SafE family protein [Lysobacter sp.]
MALTTLQYLFGAGTGSLVGFSLGLVGGGGSILAVPLMVYVVGVTNPHVAIGTSALAVAANAAVNLLNHARGGNVKWRCAALFATAGVVTAWFGSNVGKSFDGQKLLALFAVLMIVVAGLMLRSRSTDGDAGVVLNRGNAPRLLASGGATGLLSGFFGIGGGFLVVPGLMASTRMPILYAVGSSLLAVTVFGLATAVNYARSGLVDWTLAGVFIAGGVVGGLLGGRLATRLSARKGVLNVVFASLIVVVAVSMLYQSAVALGLI